MNLELVLEKHYENVKTTSIEILEELKRDSKDYKELKRNLEIFKKDLFFKYGAKQKYGSLFTEIEKILEEEMNDLPLTSHSNN